MTTADHLRLLDRLLDSQPGHAVTVPRESLVVAVEFARRALPLREAVEEELRRRDEIGWGNG